MRRGTAITLADVLRAALTLVATLTGLAIIWWVTSTNKIPTLENRMSDIKDDIARIEGDITQVEDDIDQVERDILDHARRHRD